MDPTPLAPRLDALRPLIRDALPWSPLDFVRGISSDGDRDLLAASLVRPLAPADDLRISCRLDSGAEVAVLAERLPWDSKFFGFEVARLNGVFPLGGGYSLSAEYTPAVCALIDAARAANIRYLFGVVDSRDLPLIRALTAAGFLLVETRMTWSMPVRKYEYRRRFRVRSAAASDVESLAALAGEMQNPYDRFNADPFIPKDDAVRLIATWLRASILEGFADATFIPDSAAPRTVCTVKYHDDKRAAWGASIAQQVLALSAPDAGMGMMATFSEIYYHLKERGADQVFFTTQVTNRRIARMAVHFGFEYGKAEHVFRLLL